MHARHGVQLESATECNSSFSHRFPRPLFTLFPRPSDYSAAFNGIVHAWKAAGGSSSTHPPGEVTATPGAAETPNLPPGYSM